MGDPGQGSTRSGARDRRGRGLRGRLLPPSVPAWRTRAERFDDAILDAVEHVERHAPSRLDTVEFAVEEVPPAQEDPRSRVYADDSGVALSAAWPADRRRPARVVLYRRPIEARAPHDDDLADLVEEVVVEQLADLLGIDPDELDPHG